MQKKEEEQVPQIPVASTTPSVPAPQPAQTTPPATLAQPAAGQNETPKTV